MKLCACALLAWWAVPACATDGHDDNDGVELELKIKGRISPKCEIKIPDRSVKVELFDRAGSDEVGFQLNCNQNIDVTLTSLNGGLEHESHQRGESVEGFLNFLPYSAQFVVDATGTMPVIASSTEMLSGAGGAVGHVPRGASGRLQLAWNPELPLVGGTYQDIIEIRVANAGEDGIPRP